MWAVWPRILSDGETPVGPIESAGRFPFRVAALGPAYISAVMCGLGDRQGQSNPPPGQVHDKILPSSITALCP
jgi:hypothetical protein